ncbi:MAG: hypothetical protein ACJAWV_001251 [Flammeovirgaceae bacterium]|jgi:hypothetical protein
MFAFCRHGFFHSWRKRPLVPLLNETAEKPIVFYPDTIIPSP